MSTHVVLYRLGSNRIQFEWKRVRQDFTPEQAREKRAEILKLGSNYRVLIATAAEFKRHGLPQTWDADVYFAPGASVDLND